MPDIFNIILLEDQPAVRNLVIEVLGMASEPVHVDAAESLQKARQLMRERPWHGMIADLSLIDGQSLELIADLRQQGIVIPTILISGMLSPEKERKARALGIDKILLKPFRPDALLASLDELVFRRKVADSEENRAARMVQNERIQDGLLSGLFSMDRDLDFIRRLVRELPSREDVADICAAALTLAMDMFHAEGGFVAFLDRGKGKLSLVVRHGEFDRFIANGSSNSLKPAHAKPGCTEIPADGEQRSESIVSECALDQTPFAPLLEGKETLIRVRGSELSRPPKAGNQHAKELWPGLGHGPAIAIPMCLQQRSVGVLCLVSEQWRDACPSDEDQRALLDILVPQLDTLLDNRAVHAALEESLKETLFTLVRLLEARDRYTRDHSARVSELAVNFAARMALDGETIEMIRTGGLLHDIGKVAVADAFLLKPGRLTSFEFAKIKAHPGIGDTVLSDLDSLVRERHIVRSHHERWDGCGYPDGLKGEQTPLPARIVGVADAIDAMTSHRCYRKALPLSFCREQLTQGSGTQFDPQVVEVAIDAIDEGQVHTQASLIMKMEAAAG